MTLLLEQTQEPRKLWAWLWYASRSVTEASRMAVLQKLLFQSTTRLSDWMPSVLLWKAPKKALASSR